MDTTASNFVWCNFWAYLVCDEREEVGYFSLLLFPELVEEECCFVDCDVVELVLKCNCAESVAGFVDL